MKFLKTLRNIVINLSISLASLLLVIAVAEIYLRVTPPRSDGFNVSMDSERWHERYWHVNSYGFRDREHLPDPDSGRKSLLVVGDSFAAGHGIKDPADRFSDLLGKSLGDGWEVFNVAMNGWGTRDEMEFIKALRYRPDVVVLSYYLNDIESTQLFMRNAPVYFNAILADKDSSSLFHRARRKSYLLDFVYWRLYRTKSTSNEYWQWLKDSYKSDAVWITHSRELYSLSSNLRERGSSLVVVIFPNLVDIEGSRLVTSKVDGYLKSLDVVTVDLSDSLSGIPPGERIVSSVDPHPGLKTHRLVAEIIRDKLVSEGIVSQKAR